MGSYIDTFIQGWENKLNTSVFTTIEQYEVAMICRRPSSIPQAGVYPSQLCRYSTSSQACGRRSPACRWHSLLFPGLLSAIPGLEPALSGMVPAVLGSPGLVIGTVTFFTGATRCSQVHLRTNASVQPALGVDHAGILVRQLSETPSDSQWPKYILQMLKKIQSSAIWVMMMHPAGYWAQSQKQYSSVRRVFGSSTSSLRKKSVPGWRDHRQLLRWVRYEVWYCQIEGSGSCRARNWPNCSHAIRNNIWAAYEDFPYSPWTSTNRRSDYSIGL